MLAHSLNSSCNIYIWLLLLPLLWNFSFSECQSPLTWRLSLSSLMMMLLSSSKHPHSGPLCSSLTLLLVSSALVTFLFNWLHLLYFLWFLTSCWCCPSVTIITKYLSLRHSSYIECTILQVKKLKNVNTFSLHKTIMEPKPKVELILFPTVRVQIS